MIDDVQAPSAVRPVAAEGPTIAFTPLPDALLAAADADAQWAADAAGVSIRELDGLAEVTAACQLWGEVWQVRPGQPLPVGPDLMRGLAKAGGYAAGAFDAGSGELIGACLGFIGAPVEALMHTHILGARPTGPGRNVAFALAARQRAWCLHRGIITMQWTFDPLVRRNAYLYLIKFGASPTEYLENFYGAMSGAINGDTETDRLLVQRDLRLGVGAPAPADPPAAALPLSAPAVTSLEAELSRGATVALGADPAGWPLAGAPGTGPGQPLLVGVPSDIEDIRRTDPSRAAAWRQALRDVLVPLMSAGARVTGFDRAGWYVLSPGQPAALSGQDGMSTGTGTANASAPTPARPAPGIAVKLTALSESSPQETVRSLMMSEDEHGGSRACALGLAATGLPPAATMTSPACWKPREPLSGLGSITSSPEGTCCAGTRGSRPVPRRP